MKLSKAEAARLNGKKGGRPRKARATTTAVPSVNPPAATQPVVPPPEAAPVDNPFDLSPKELLFVEFYCGAAQFNATKAYEMAGYKVSRSARFGAAHLATRVHVAQAIAARLSARVEAARVMGGDEALERLSKYARADIGQVLDENDPLRQLPDDVRLTIKAVRPNRFGRAIELYDAMKATELMAKADGKLKETVKHEHTLEEIMALSHRLPATPGKGAAA